jgi:hypothetical protein
MKNFNFVLRNTVTIVLFSFVFLFGSGCSTVSSSSKSADQQDPSKTIVENAPYYATEFNDLLIPGELKFNNDKTMSIKTDSFAGGILHFSGRVEMNSLAGFFESSMVKNGWKLTGTIKHKEVLLAFVKPNKTCMIRVIKSGFGMGTEVFVYMTVDIASSKKQQTPVQ